MDKQEILELLALKEWELQTQENWLKRYKFLEQPEMEKLALEQIEKLKNQIALIKQKGGL